MTPLEKFKAEVILRARWIGWLVSLVLAVLFVIFNIKVVQMKWIIIDVSAPGALIFAGLFMLGWYAGAIFQFTATKVREIEQKYRARMAVRPKPVGESPQSVSLAAQPSAPVPAEAMMPLPTQEVVVPQNSSDSEPPGGTSPNPTSP